MARVGADLVGTPGEQLRFDVTAVAKWLQQPEPRQRSLARVLHCDRPTGLAGQPGQRGIDVDYRLGQQPVHQAEVALAHRPVPELCRQLAQRPAAAGQHQAAAGFAVESVGQFEVLARAVLAQRVDHAPGQAAAGVHGHSSRLVEDQQVAAIEQDGLAELQANIFGDGMRLVWSGSGRWYPQLVAFFKARSRLGPAAVDPDLAGADHAVDRAARNALEQGHQVIVQALPAAVGIDLDPAHAGVLLPRRICRLIRHLQLIDSP
jgi:hypothetical protein